MKAVALLNGRQSLTDLKVSFAIAEEWERSLSYLSSGLILICWNLSQKVEVLILKLVITKG
jgi:hypothetical protein